MTVDQTGPPAERDAAGMDRAMIRLGFVLILLSLIGGVVAPTLMVNPRLGAGAHIIGLFGGLILIAVGATRPAFALGGTLRRMMNGCWLGATYGNWAGTMLAGLTGASHLTPIAGAGSVGPPIAETIVIVFFCLVGVTSVVAAVIAIYGLRRVGRGL
jgi:hydroxylaminobenzene mutase